MRAQDDAVCSKVRFRLTRPICHLRSFIGLIGSQKKSLTSFTILGSSWSLAPIRFADLKDLVPSMQHMQFVLNRSSSFREYGLKVLIPYMVMTTILDAESQYFTQERSSSRLAYYTLSRTDNA